MLVRLRSMGIVVSLEARRQGRPARGGGRTDRPRVALYFDLADPGTYLAAERVDRLFGGVAWIPASLDVLRTTCGGGHDPGDEAVMARAGALRMPLVWPERHPAPRPAAMRAAAYASEQGRGAPFVLAASRLAFCGGFGLGHPEVVAGGGAAAGARPPAGPAGARGRRGCPAAAGAAERDTGMEAEAHRLVPAGADRLPVMRVGRLVFA